jgi:hypothetical protein
VIARTLGEFRGRRLNERTIITAGAGVSEHAYRPRQSRARGARWHSASARRTRGASQSRTILYNPPVFHRAWRRLRARRSLRSSPSPRSHSAWCHHRDYSVRRRSPIRLAVPSRSDRVHRRLGCLVRTPACLALRPVSRGPRRSAAGERDLAQRRRLREILPKPGDALVVRNGHG